MASRVTNLLEQILDREQIYAEADITNVRFWHKADILVALADVRFRG